MRGGPVGVFLVAALLAAVGGCDAAAPDGPAEPAAVPFTAVELPAGAVPEVLATELADGGDPGGAGLLVGVRRDGRPELLRRGPDDAVAPVPLRGVSPYALTATWHSIATDGERVVAVGGERGGAHGNVRWSVWSGSAAGLAEQPQGFSTFGGWGAGDLLDAVLTPAGPALVGTWQSAQVGFDVAVWTPDGDVWTRRSSAGTALESARGSLGFPISAAALGRGIVVTGWRLGDGQQQATVWRSAEGNTGWTSSALPQDGRAGAAVAVRCRDDGCGAVGWVDGTLAVWRLAGADWTRLAGVPPIPVGDRDELAAPVEVDGEPVVVVPDDGRLRLARADGDGWTVRDVTGPSGTVTAMAVVGGALYLLAGPDENTRTLWRADLAALG